MHCLKKVLNDFTLLKMVVTLQSVDRKFDTKFTQKDKSMHLNKNIFCSWLFFNLNFQTDVELNQNIVVT